MKPNISTVSCSHNVSHVTLTLPVNLANVSTLICRCDNNLSYVMQQCCNSFLRVQHSSESWLPMEYRALGIKSTGDLLIFV